MRRRRRSPPGRGTFLLYQAQQTTQEMRMRMHMQQRKKTWKMSAAQWRSDRTFAHVGQVS